MNDYQTVFRRHGHPALGRQCRSHHPAHPRGHGAHPPMGFSWITRTAPASGWPSPALRFPPSPWRIWTTWRPRSFSSWRWPSPASPTTSSTTPPNSPRRFWQTARGTVIIERCIGFVTNGETGDGELLNPADPDYAYISYAGMESPTGTARDPHLPDLQPGEFCHRRHLRPARHCPHPGV